MEYKKYKRTKNLTLRDIHVGDWVQGWSEKTERYSPPMKIISIHDDGSIYLVTSDEERCTPWEENIKNVDALEIDADLLRGFGFEVIPINYTKDECNVLCGECDKFLYEDTDGYGICEKTNEECRCSDKCHLTHGKP